MDDSFHTIGSAGLALVATGGIYWLYGAALLFPRMHDSAKAHVRFGMTLVIALNLSITGFICLGGWMLHRVEADLWAHALAAIAGAAMMLFVYLLHHRLKVVDQDKGVGLLAGRSVNGLMIDLTSSAPAGALLWVTLSN